MIGWRGNRSARGLRARGSSGPPSSTPLECDWSIPRRRLDPAHGKTQGVHAGELEAGRRCHHPGHNVERRSREDLPGVQDGEAVYPDDGATAVEFVPARVLLRRNASEYTTGTDGEVANALVCKTSIHGFKSHSVLQLFQ